MVVTVGEEEGEEARDGGGVEEEQDDEKRNIERNKNAMSGNSFAAYSDNDTDRMSVIAGGAGGSPISPVLMLVLLLLDVTLVTVLTPAAGIDLTAVDKVDVVMAGDEGADGQTGLCHRIVKGRSCPDTL